ncbi:MAG: ZIP family metal transporter [Gammaproteobacteria bacterium]|nr:ZIP family metal transporter [Gammaproteobacteria bacterium]
MSLSMYKLIAAAAILITSLIAVIYPVKMRAHPGHHPLLERGDAFASGIFLGAALFHMLPDALTIFNQLLSNIHFPIAESFCAAGFLVLLFLEKLSGFLNHKNITSSISLLLAAILIVHALIEGAALGITTTAATTTILFLAIIVHKGSESFALAMILNRSHLMFIPILITIGLFACMTPLGILFGSLLTQTLKWNTGQLTTAAFNAFAAGTFLYMSTLHHINHHHEPHEKESFVEFWFLVAGLCTMALLALWT